MTPRERKLKRALDALVRNHGSGQLSSDPLRFPRRYADPADSEVAALLCALYAYGNVKAMGTFLEALLGRLGDRPARVLKQGVPSGRWPAYRFQTGADARALLRSVGGMLRRHGSLEAAFASEPGTASERLQDFALRLRVGAGEQTRGLRHLLPMPSDGSACKRWWLFLRWVCRPDDGLDLGLWTCVDPSELLLPVDVHVARMARGLGLSRRTTPDGRFALEATEALRRLDPRDPVRYDFALARPGILGECPCEPGSPSRNRCPLKDLCDRTA